MHRGSYNRIGVARVSLSTIGVVCKRGLSHPVSILPLCSVYEPYHVTLSVSFRVGMTYVVEKTMF